MRQLGCATALLLLVATPAFAKSVLYATAASEQRVDAFCLEDNGGIVNTNVGHFGTSGIEPRRLLVAEGVITDPTITDSSRDVLYVALADRVEAFRILARGGLVSLGSTKVLEFMDTA